MGAKASRASFGEALTELAAGNDRVVVVDADLSKSTMTCKFAEAYPERYFEVGIAEGNMVSVGAGLALSGKIAVVSSFACFLVGRFEQIRMSVGYSNANVKLVGTHVGIGIGEDGYSQMGLEDIALMRSLPNIPVIQPADDIEARQAVAFMLEHEGPVYLRCTRQKLEDVNGPDYKFELGKGTVLCDGSDLAIFASGGTVGHALKAAEALKADGVSAQVINISTIKPIDRELVVQAAKDTGKILTVEDHNVVGGLGDAVAEVLCAEQPALLYKHGMTDYGESGTGPQLYKKYKLDAEGILSVAKEFLKS
jgi:transketolase